MGFYRRHIFPKLLDVAMSDKPMGRERDKLLGNATGTVVEIGMGTGANLPYYKFDQVKELIGVEPAHELAPKLHESLAACPEANVRILPVSATSLPLDNNSADTVVVTYTLCSIDQVEEALTEARRILKPKGTLLFLEHGKSVDTKVARVQRRIEPFWQLISGGCSLLKHPPTLLDNTGFTIKSCHEHYLPGPRPLRYNFSGIAEIA